MSGITTISQTQGGYDLVTGVGTTLAGAPVLTGAVTKLLANTGATAATLPATPNFGGPVVVHVDSTSTGSGLVFPATASITILPSAAGASFTVAAGKTATFFPVNATTWVAQLGA